MILYIVVLILIVIIVGITYSQKESFTDSTIPLKIFQTWSTKELPFHMTMNCVRLQKQNPQFKYYLFDDDDCDDFIKTHFKPEVLETYHQLIPGAYKADLWRYCVLYIYGGIYLDMKMRCVGDFRLIELTKKEHYVRDRPQVSFITNTVGIYNAVMIQKPKNPLMMDCILKIIENVKNQEYGFSSLYPTGPGMLGELYVKKKKQYRLPDFDLFHDSHKEVIRFKNRTILEHYSEYRTEQLTHQNELHYSVLWEKNSIYAL